MIDLVFTVFFVVMSFRCVTGLSRSSAVMKEFSQTQSLKYAALFLSFGPITLIIGQNRLMFPIAYLVAAACYIPALLIARNCSRALEVAGTDRVQLAQESVRRTLDTSLLGIAYVIVMFTLVAGAQLVA